MSLKMLLLLLASLAAQCLAAGPQQQGAAAGEEGSFSGQAAVGGFAEFLPQNGTADLACGLAGVSPYFTVHVAALSLAAHPAACGR